MTPNICVSSVFNVLDVTFMTPRILGGSYLFWGTFVHPCIMKHLNAVGDHQLLWLSASLS